MAAPPAPQESVDPDAAPGPIRLLTNLFTRVGAAVTINGQGPFLFVIDTGSAATAVADTVAEALALPGRGPVLIHGITAATEAESVTVDRLRLNGLTFRDLRCPVLSRVHLGADGLLGLDVLGRFRLDLDIPRRAASLRAGGARLLFGGDPDMTTGSRLRRGGLASRRGRFGQLIFTEVAVGDQPTAAFVDSGAQYSIGNPALLGSASWNDRVAPAGEVLPLYGVTGQSLPAELAIVPDLRLGPSRLGPTPLLFADLHCFDVLGLADRPALLIGADILGRFRQVTLDFPTGLVAFEGLRRRRSLLEEPLRK